MLEGQDLTVYTDHKPLVYMFIKNVKFQLDRRIRHISFIQQFTSNIKYIKGDSNIVADALSHTELEAIQALLTIQRIAQE